MKVFLFSVFAFLAVPFTSHSASVAIIDETTGNGDFETGDPAPWISESYTTGHPPAPAPLTLTTDSQFASHGNWSAKLETLPAQGNEVIGQISQEFVLDVTKGQYAVLTFSIRIPSENALSLVAWGINQRISTGSTSAATEFGQVGLPLFPELSATQWTTVTKYFYLSPYSSGNRVYFYLEFQKGLYGPAAAVGQTYSVFVDNVTLMQTSENPLPATPTPTPVPATPTPTPGLATPTPTPVPATPTPSLSETQPPAQIAPPKVFGQPRLETNRSTITIHGAATPANIQINYRLNDGPKRYLSNPDQLWKLKLKLKPGRNILKITNFDPLSNRASRTTTIFITRS